MKIKRQSGQMITLVIVLAASLNALAPSGYSRAAIIPDSSIATSSTREVDQPNDLLTVPANADQAVQARVNETYRTLPLRFEANAGQAGPNVKFIAKGGGYDLCLTASETILTLSKPQSPEKEDARSSLQTSPLRMKLVGGNQSAPLEGIDQLPGKSHYFIGNRADQRRTNLSSFGRVQRKNVYRGIDLVYYGDQQQLEYDFNVAAGADPSMIALDFDGAQRLRIDANGDLILSTPGGEVRQHKPVIYQEVNGAKQVIAGRYEIKGRHRVGFRASAYDRTRALVIDPVLSYSSFLNGASNVLTVDSEGSIYVAGFANASGFPTTPGAFQPAYSGGRPQFENDYPPGDIAITKLNRDCSAVIYATYLGGTGADNVSSVAVDADGNVYLTGNTFSPDFPTTQGAYRTTYAGGLNISGRPASDVFVAKLDRAGAALIYSTYVGGTNQDGANSIAVDAAGNAYISGGTWSHDFPTTANAFQITFGGGSADAFVAKLNAKGSALVYSTYLGGDNYEDYTYLALDAAGNAYVTGTTSSSNFPTTPGALQTSRSDLIRMDVFVSKLNAAGSALIYSTLLGGSFIDQSWGIAIDAAGDAYVVGETSSADFPTVNALQKGHGGGPLLKSVNGGASWSAKSLPDTSINAIATAPDNLYVATSRGVFRSTDGGTNFSATGLANTNVRCLAVDPQSSATVYAVTYNYASEQPGPNGVFKTTDGGATWMATELTNQYPGSLVIDPRNPSTIYLSTWGDGSDRGVFKSTDGGHHWMNVNKGLNDLNVMCLGIDSNNPATLYAGTWNGLFKSEDGGENWKSTVVIGTVEQLSMDPRTPTTFYACVSSDAFTLTSFDGRGNPRRRLTNGNPTTAGGAVKTTDGGATWKTLILDFPEYQNQPFNFSSLVVDPQNPSTLYALGQSVYKSLDGGTNWTKVAPEIFGRVYARVLAIDASNGSLYSGLSDMNANAFVAKLNPSGAALVFSTYLGGLFGDSARDVAVDSAGNVCVVGQTTSKTFPVSSDAASATIRGDFDGFLMKLNGDGKMVYSSYVGGNSSESIRDLALDSVGNVYITGSTASADFPLVNPLKATVDYLGLYYVPSPYPGVVTSSDFISKVRFAPDPPPAPPPAPTIQSISPGTGSAAGGTAITITGKGFAQGAVVTVGGAPATATDVVNSMTIIATTGARGAGLADVVVTNPDNQRASVADAFKYVVVPRITGASISGKKLIIVGESFSQGAVIMLDGNPQPTSNDPQSMESRLISKKAGKKIQAGQRQIVQVKNVDGTMSQEYPFVRSGN